MGGVNECGCLDFDILVEVELCGELGPVRGSGLIGTRDRCTRPDRHDGAHAAWLGGRLVDTWPRETALT